MDEREVVTELMAPEAFATERLEADRDVGRASLGGGVPVAAARGRVSTGARHGCSGAVAPCAFR